MTDQTKDQCDHELMAHYMREWARQLRSTPDARTALAIAEDLEINAGTLGDGASLRARLAALVDQWRQAPNQTVLECAADVEDVLAGRWP